MEFIGYNAAHFNECVTLFEQNCPSYFAENEREDYIRFLQTEPEPSGYFVGVIENQLVSAFGVSNTPETKRARLSWILVSPSKKGLGIGNKMMTRAQIIAQEKGATVLDIAASHLSAPFFKAFGAQERQNIPHGWGIDMHRVDMEITFERDKI